MDTITSKACSLLDSTSRRVRKLLTITNREVTETYQTLLRERVDSLNIETVRMARVIVKAKNQSFSDEVKGLAISMFSAVCRSREEVCLAALEKLGMLCDQVVFAVESFCSLTEIGFDENKPCPGYHDIAKEAVQKVNQINSRLYTECCALGIKHLVLPSHRYAWSGIETGGIFKERIEKIIEKGRPLAFSAQTKMTKIRYTALNRGADHEYLDIRMRRMKLELSRLNRVLAAVWKDVAELPI